MRAIHSSSATFTSMRARFEPKAAVDAEPERRVSIHRSVDLEDVGVGQELRVAVCGREGQQHPLTWAQRLARHLDLIEHHPRHRHRRVEPQELLHRGVDQLGFGGETPSIFRVMAEVP